MKNVLLAALLFISISLLADGVLPAGAGTSGDPYQIADLDNLLWVSTNSGSWDNHFIQTADINAADTQNWNSGAGFISIGNNSNDFDGNYNGQGFVIDSLYINRPSTNYIGFFGRCYYASISNLGVTNAGIIGDGKTGIAVGNCSNSTISNCFSSGSVVANDYDSGGLIGKISYSTVSKCYSHANVNAGYDDHVGGLIGSTSYSSISNCYSTGNVSGDFVVGGLIGDLLYESTLSDCYSIGHVNGSYSTGGLIGRIYSSPINNCFWNTQTSGQSSSQGGSGKTTVQMQTMSTFTDAGWDFIEETTNGSNDYWGINTTNNGMYPFLSWQGYVHNYSAPAGSGTEADPYAVESIGHLAWIADDNTFWDDYIIQTADIYASSTVYWNNGAGFIPIGVNDTNTFSGNYDGQGFVIDGLFINKASGRTGLFGNTNYATISNLGVLNVDISAYSQTGALVGLNTNSTITNCYSSGNVSGDWTTAGLVGRNNTGIITECYSSVNVDASGDHNGGLVGSSNANSTIENCYATGDVVGYEEDLGGLVGENNNNSIIANSYSTGNVSGGSAHIGGLVGRSLNGAVTNNSFWDTESSGQAASAGGTGKTTAEMKTLSTFTDAGWDFAGETNNGSDDFWNHNVDYQDSYPSLFFQSYLPIVTTTIATSITNNSAASGGEVTYDGYDNDTAYGVCWSTSSNPTIADSTTNDGTGTGIFTSAITGLTYGTIYYYRAYATNSVGTCYGPEYNFLTMPLGSGTSGDPYQISSLNELRWLSEHSSYWSAHIIQTEDIDATDTQNWNSGTGFIPIGNSSTYFTGVYNGKGYEIDGLYVNRSNSSYQALFGYADGASIDSLGVTNVNITGDYYCAGLVGYCYNYTSIYKCYSTGSVSAENYAGGLVGYFLYYSYITNCYTTCSVTGDYFIGGLVAYKAYSSSVNKCYSVGSVSGNGNVGGLVGNSGSGSVTGSFWDTETSGQSSSAGGTGKTTAEMQTLSTFISADWDFMDESANGAIDIWGINYSDNGAYPFLSWQGFVHNAYPCDGAGTEADPYLVDSHYDLIWISMETSTWSSYFLQTADIDASLTMNLNEGSGFSPIGNSSTKFTGNYDGQMFELNGLYINRTESDEQSLFGYTIGADISNMVITEADISGRDRAAGLVGFATSNTVIYNCSVTGSVNADWTSGGLVGKNSNSVVSQCYTTANVTCIGDRIGGLVGYNNNGDIINSYCSGDVIGITDIGGLVGKNDSGAIINYCYSTGSATGSSGVGGLVGSNSSTVNNSFWDTEASGNSNGAGGTGKTTAEMQTINTFTDAGWDFVGEFTNGSENIWYISYQLEEYPQFTTGADIILYSVSDVIPDQGRQVMLQWNRATADTEYSMQNFYSVWRLREYARSLPENAVIIKSPKELKTTNQTKKKEITWNNREDFWTFVDQVPAVMLTDYSYVSPTLVDSSTVLLPEDYTSVFMIMFHTEENLYQSPANSGYSVDNIAPNAAANIAIALNVTNRNIGNNKRVRSMKVSINSDRKARNRFDRNESITLSWDEVSEGNYQGNSYPEQNGIWYRVYSSNYPNFVCDENTYLTTTQNTNHEIDITGAEKMFFRIIVSDQE